MTFAFLGQPQTPTAPTQVRNMQDVWDYFACQAEDPTDPKKNNPQGWRMQYLTKLQSNCGGMPLGLIWPGEDDLLAAFDRDFPKPKKGVHPRPDLNQKFEAYKSWRTQARKCIEMATGVTAEKEELRARKDGWADLLAGIQLHLEPGGAIKNQQLIIPVTNLSDIARRANVEPWELADDGVLDRLKEGFAAPKDVASARRAQAFLNNFRALPELAAVLPAKPVLVFPKQPRRAAIPAHIDAYLEALIEGACSDEIDEVSGLEEDPTSDAMKASYRTALRHHIRALPHCLPEPDLNYLPITDLESVNDLASLFAPEHLYATLRHTADVADQPNAIKQRTAYNYYKAIGYILKENNPKTDDLGEQIDPDAQVLIVTSTIDKIKNTRFMKEGKELSEGMTEKNKNWCKRLVSDPAKTRSFQRMHLTMMSTANKILDQAKAEGRPLTNNELIKVRQVGSCAAACAIEFAGRPIRMSNVLSLRLYGPQKNFFTPGKGRKTYSFKLFADETKSGKEEENTPLKQQMGGTKVLDWYMKNIRPLFPLHATSTYLFPGVEVEGQHLGHALFDTWFQRAATSAGLPMTFHQWRHGYASILLADDWSNLQVAASMLGNTPEVCAKNYAWIDKTKMIEKGQDVMLKSMQEYRS